MPQEQDPTQIIQAPDTGITPSAQAGSPGQTPAPPEGEGGKTYDQEYVDRLKAKAEGSKQEAERLLSERDLLKSNNELLMRQPTQPAPVVPAVPTGPAYNPDTFLTSEEEAIEEKAYEDLDRKEITRLQLLKSGRQNAASQANMLQALGTAASKSQTINSVTSNLNAAEEFKDPAVRQKLLLETQSAMRDPNEVAKYADGQWNVAGVGNINPFILMDKLKDYRISKGGAIKAAAAGPEHHGAMGGDGPSSAQPGAGSDTFDASIHLTDSERSAAVKGMSMKGMPTSGLSDASEAYSKIWGGMSEEVRAYRIKNGAPVTAETGKSASTIWTAKKKSA